MHPHKDLGKGRRIYSWLPHAGFKPHSHALVSIYIQYDAQSELAPYNTKDIRARVEVAKKSQMAAAKELKRNRKAKEAEEARIQWICTSKGFLN